MSPKQRAAASVLRETSPGDPNALVFPRTPLAPPLITGPGSVRGGGKRTLAAAFFAALPKPDWFWRRSGLYIAASSLHALSVAASVVTQAVP